jgi:antitoxin MazE
MHTTIARWDNSLALRIPEPLARQLALGEGTVVTLLVENGRLECQREQVHPAVDEPLGGIIPKDLMLAVA